MSDNSPFHCCATKTAPGRARFWGVCLVLVCLVCCSLARAQNPTDLKKGLEKKKEQAQQQRQTLKHLSTQEQQLYANLAATEKRIQNLRSQLASHKNSLENLRKRQQDLTQKIQRLQTRRHKHQNQLHSLLQELWPVHLARKYGVQTSNDTWSQTDRRLTWLKTYYDRARNHLASIQQQAQQIAAARQQQEEAAAATQRELDTLSQTREKLLDDRLRYLNRVREIRSKRLAKEEQLSEIQETIESLEYTLKSLSSHSFKDQKGYLPWPAQGRIIREFAPQAANPHRGVGLAVSNPAVKAVSWGKVVHNDQLRGFGHVVILLHQGGYYSLYAFLEQSDVTLGQQVEKGERIGEAGFYPEADGVGLYFELRFHQKVINPEQWLASR